jgi:CubicO group peptidase (beta-lactamase class C family)
MGAMDRLSDASAGGFHTDLDSFVHDHVRRGDWPGAVYAAGAPAERPRWCAAVGALALAPRREPARVDALYDLASITKGLATGVIALRLAGRGVVDLDAPLDELLPESRGYAGRTPSLADLLLHRAGFPDWAPLYRLARTPETTAEAACGAPPVAPNGQRVLYSCLGPILAGLALERRTGASVRELWDAEVRLPLTLPPEGLLFGPLPPELVPRAAPTESGRRHEESIAGPGEFGREIAPGPAAPLRGVVNDGNACFLGGAAGNAGLFGAADVVFRVASALAAPGPLLADREWRRAVQPAATGSDDARTIGFQSGASPKAPAGALGAASFGHVGFTGVSVWIAPQLELVAVLLSNRIHPRYTEAPVQTWRREFHDAVVRAASRERS